MVLARLRLYKYTRATRELTPRSTKDDRHSPHQLLGLNMLTPQGKQRLREVVGHVNDMCAWLARPTETHQVELV